MAIFRPRGPLAPSTLRWGKYEVSGGARGDQVGVVRSRYAFDYPDNGEQDGYWYTRIQNTEFQLALDTGDIPNDITVKINDTAVSPNTVMHFPASANVKIGVSCPYGVSCKLYRAYDFRGVDAYASGRNISMNFYLRANARMEYESDNSVVSVRTNAV